MIKLAMPAAVTQVLAALHAHHFEAYIVGGCVRDCMMGRTPKDWDVTTSATPPDVKRIFPKTFDTGARFGTITVMQAKEGIEVTTFRSESGYSDGRHPDQVTFAGTLSEDLSRRDFTINAMAYNEQHGLVDLYGGRRDIESKQIRGVGEARLRLQEDALRMLRAIRFSAQLGFCIETDTWNAILQAAENIQKISIERIRDEFCKTIVTDRPDRLVLLKESGMLSFFLLPLAALDFDTLDCNRFPPDITMRLAYLFSHTLFESEKDFENCLKDFRLDNKMVKLIKLLVSCSAHLSDPLQRERVAIKRLIGRIGTADFCYLCEYLQHNGQDGHTLLQLLDDIKSHHECVSLKDLAVNGKDLMAIGIRGSQVGVVLQMLLETVYQDAAANDKKFLLEEATAFVSESLQNPATTPI